MQGIYKITSPIKRIYIGQSINIHKRFNQYKLLQCKRQVKLYNSFNKYGVDKHKFEILCESINSDELNKLEIYYIELFNCLHQKNGLNCKEGGKNARLSQETKNKISESKIGKPSWNKGIKMSDEQKNKLSIAKKGKPWICINGRIQSQQQKDKFIKLITGNKFFLGKKHTTESKIAIGKASIGRNLDSIKKIILNKDTGVFYLGYKEAAFSINITPHRLRHMMKGNCNNKFDFFSF